MSFLKKIGSKLRTNFEHNDLRFKEQNYVRVPEYEQDWTDDSSIYLQFRDVRNEKTYEQHVWMINDFYRRNNLCTPSNRYARYEPMYKNLNDAIEGALLQLEKEEHINPGYLRYVGFIRYSEKYPPYNKR